MAKIVSTNPATGEVIREIDATPIESLPAIYERARTVQKSWAALSARKRAEHLLQFRETLLNHVEDLSDLITQENGKPKLEAMVNDIVPVVELITYFAKHGPKLLANRKIPLRLLYHRTSYLNHWPLGTVLVVSPWNFPFSIATGDIVLALLAGNSVIFKPSEVTPLVGLKVQEFFDEAGLPPYVLQTVVGGPDLGAACIEQKPAKIFFTGSVATGRKIMAAAAKHLIPVNLELGGKDAMIVMPDADIDHASSAALWGGFANAGQICASVERILVHESIRDPFLKELTAKAAKLRQGPSLGTDNDLGPVTFEKQKAIYEQQLLQAREKGATFVAGGEFSPDRRFLQPTIVTGPGIEQLDVYNEETFGPVIAVTTFKSPTEAIEKANRSRYGLLASVFTRNLRMGERMAQQIEAGTVIINDAVYTHGVAETPWGGVKESGFGRTHSELGLLEFVNVRHIHKPRSRLLSFKSPWWFPYTPHQYQTFRQFLELYRSHWTDKIKAFPHLLWNLVQLIKREKRL